jgi:uncharacterized repeat protein (TIGR01451 family)
MKKILLIYLALGIALILFLFLKITDQTSATALNISTTIERENEIEQIGPPWYDEDWHYRVPIYISSNSDTPISYYQVLIALTSGNFNFNLAEADGSDIYFSSSNGRDPISFWIESWDKLHQKAFIWVSVPGLMPDPFDTTIYLYYNNPSAISESNGTNTFDLFDDNWCGINGSGCTLNGISINSQNNRTNQSESDFKSNYSSNGIINSLWVTIGSPYVSSGILNLDASTGIRSSNPTYNPGLAVGFKAEYGDDTDKAVGGFLTVDTKIQTGIGDLITDTVDLYLINKGDGTDKVILEGDWRDSFHIYEVRWKNGQSTGDIDHGSVHQSSTSHVPSIPLPVTFLNMTGSSATLKVAWVYLRQYRDPEPSATLGEPQGLVDLGVTLSDSPDPIPQGNDLTYVVTAFNDSDIEAPGVVVTDTLPNAVTFVSANAPGGCSHNGNLVVCNLNAIPANSSRNATIVAKPTADGNLSNSAVVGSPSYELELSNNNDQITTLVDSIPPTVSWLLPTTNRNTFYTQGGWVTLEATASDIGSQVARVEFWRYINTEWIMISSITTSPYRYQYDSDDLAPNVPWTFEVFAFDQAGNKSVVVPVEMRQVIWIERISVIKVYLPLTKR